MNWSYFYIFTALTACAAGAARAESSRCFERHLTDAIELNTQREPIYSALSGGESVRLSQELIRFEKIALIDARLFEARVEKYHEAGIPILCDDFVPMSTVSDLPLSELPKKPSFQTYQARPSLDLTWSLLKALKTEGEESIAQRAIAELKELGAEPQYHCLRRHFLESIARSGRLAPRYIKMAQEKGLSSPESISKDFMRVQILSLAHASRLDDQAASLQSQGIPIFCSDIPKIPIPGLVNQPEEAL
jgi:hypothetical protein